MGAPLEEALRKTSELHRSHRGTNYAQQTRRSELWAACCDSLREMVLLGNLSVFQDVKMELSNSSYGGSVDTEEAMKLSRP
jgi:hypothetical protein